MLIINLELQESATFITPWDALVIGTKLFHFRHNVGSGEGTLGITGVWA